MRGRGGARSPGSQGGVGEAPFAPLIQSSEGPVLFQGVGHDPLPTLLRGHGVHLDCSGALQRAQIDNY